MEINELRRGLRFLDPESTVSVRNRDNWRWNSSEIWITNLRRHGDNPEDITVYYKNNGGSTFKSDALTFVNKYGDFIKEAGYPSPAISEQPDMTDPNPAAIPNNCPGCGVMIDRPMYYGAEGHEVPKEYECPKCGMSIDLSTAADEEFLVEPGLFRDGGAKLSIDTDVSVEEQAIIETFLKEEGLEDWYWSGKSSLVFDDEFVATQARDILTDLLDVPVELMQGEEHKRRIFVDDKTATQEIIRHLEEDTNCEVCTKRIQQGDPGIYVDEADSIVCSRHCAEEMQRALDTYLTVY